MRFIVYGAGAVGGVVGGRMFQHGHDVVLVARPAIEGSTTNDLVSEMRDLLPQMGIDTDPELPS